MTAAGFPVAVAGGAAGLSFTTGSGDTDLTMAPASGSEVSEEPSETLSLHTVG